MGAAGNKKPKKNTGKKHTPAYEIENAENTTVTNDFKKKK
ncbi:MAG: RNA-binding protein [Rikenellaceae bacterium]